MLTAERYGLPEKRASNVCPKDHGEHMDFYDALEIFHMSV